MVQKCCVPKCRGNYTNDERASVFSFPKDEILRRKWIKAINRERDFEPTINHKVCIRHFTEDQIRRTTEAYDENGKKLVARLKRLYVKVGAVPSVFGDNVDPLSFQTSLRNNSKRKKTLNTNETDESDSEDLISLDDKEFCDDEELSLGSNENSNALKTFRDFTECLVNRKFSDWCVVEKDDVVVFAMIFLSEVPTISESVIVNTNLEVRIFKGTDELKTLNSKVFPFKISNMNQIEIILNDLSSASSVTSRNVIKDKIKTSTRLLKEVVQHDSSHHTEVSFLCEQINLLLYKKYQKYSVEYMIFCCVLWLISPYAYEYLLKAHLFALPQIHTLSKLCPKYDPNANLENLHVGDLTWVRQKARNLEPKELVVSLLVDEIRLRPYFGNTDGDILQRALNITNRAKIAQVYTIKSLNGSFKEVVHILPMKEMDSDTLFLIIKRIIIDLHEVGFTVVCVVTNNSPFSKGAISNFASPPTTQIVYKHPVNQSKPLFHTFDSTQVLESIRNDWANQNDEVLLFPKFDSFPDTLVADFSELEKLCEIKESKRVKKSKSLNFIELRRRNIRSVLNTFNNTVIEVLKRKGEKYKYPHFKTTAGFMEIIVNWWSVMNKVSSENISHDYKFLEHCLVWLDYWADLELVDNKFSDDTHESITHTIYCFLQLSEYCKSELNFEYILPSKIQTDILEARYGAYKIMPIYDEPVESR